ncbi:MAG: DUF1080 domain-containing protein [Planctomycetaceae bacterium]|jgi:hypothetical protein|nr:DUF1080 domain-containing protein [Planctomycetaceae bacterium]
MFLFCLTCACFTHSAVLTAAEPIHLFADKNLRQWQFHTDQAGIKAEDVFAFTEEGTLTCKGQPFGWLGTKKMYRNFRLAAEYRWVGEPTNSGIFVRITRQPQNTFLPRCCEIQLKYQNNGDLVGLHGMKLPAPAGTAADRIINRNGGKKIGQLTGVKKLTDAESEKGSWNSLEIFCHNGLIVVVENGKMVNWVLDAEPSAGFIGFQSEGGGVEFRNAVLSVIR